MLQLPMASSKETPVWTSRVISAGLILEASAQPLSCWVFGIQPQGFIFYFWRVGSKREKKSLNICFESCVLRRAAWPPEARATKVPTSPALMKVQTRVIVFRRKDTVKARASRENIFYSFLKLQLCLHAILVVYLRPSAAMETCWFSYRHYTWEHRCNLSWNITRPVLKSVNLCSNRLDVIKKSLEKILRGEGRVGRGFKPSGDDAKWAEKHLTVIPSVLHPLSFHTYKRRRGKKAWSSSVLFIFM